MNTTTADSKKQTGRPKIYLTKIRRGDGLPRSFYTTLARFSNHTQISIGALVRSAVARYILGFLKEKYPDVSTDEFDAELSAIYSTIPEDGNGKEQTEDIRVSEVQRGV